MTDHVGYEPHAIEGRGSGNSRNGTYPKSVTTEIGKVDLRVPRDRNGTYEDDAYADEVNDDETQPWR
jgi:transposase-like protein